MSDQERESGPLDAGEREPAPAARPEAGGHADEPGTLERGPQQAPEASPGVPSNDRDEAERPRNGRGAAGAHRAAPLSRIRDWLGSRGRTGTNAATERRPAGAPLVGGRTAYGLAFLSGLLYFLAFPGIELWPLAFVALVPLIIALRGQTPRRATALGWLAGFTMTMTGFYWLLDMLRTFSGFPISLCLLFMALLCGYQAGRIALCGWLYARAERRRWPKGLTFMAAFAASELVFPLLFPWTYAATVHQLPAFLQVAELAGPNAVVVVLVAANLLIAEPIAYWLEGRARSSAQAPGRLIARQRLYRHLARLAAVVAGALVFGVVRIRQIDAQVAAAPKARVGVVQANMSLFGKRRDRQLGLERHLELTQELTQEGPLDLAVWSETSVTGVKWERSADRELRHEVTRRVDVPLLFGAVLGRPVNDAREYVLYNSALLADEHGRLCQDTQRSGAPNGEVCDLRRYDKRYLLAFGEYLPLGETFPVLYEWSPNSGHFTPGTRFEPLTLGDRQIAVFICYEDIIPAYVNKIVRNGTPDLLVNMTNDAWFGDTTEPWIHFALAQLRAVEHRRFLVRSTNSGVSGFVDPVGRVVKHGGTFRQEAFAAEIAWLRTRTAYELFGDIPWLLVALGVFAAGWVSAPRSKASEAMARRALGRAT